eukprot:jgi/Botrbrau1/576/Bobra.0010s0042.1
MRWIPGEATKFAQTGPAWTPGWWRRGWKILPNGKRMKTRATTMRPSRTSGTTSCQSARWRSRRYKRPCQRQPPSLPARQESWRRLRKGGSGPTASESRRGTAHRTSSRPPSSQSGPSRRRHPPFLPRGAGDSSRWLPREPPPSLPTPQSGGRWGTPRAACRPLWSLAPAEFRRRERGTISASHRLRTWRPQLGRRRKKAGRKNLPLLLPGIDLATSPRRSTSSFAHAASASERSLKWGNRIRGQSRQSASGNRGLQKVCLGAAK